MPYNISFISLGCAKNQVNCEQMMASVQAAGHTVQAQPEGADVVVVNTCGFLQSACEEAIDNILEMAELKRAGQVQKILVTGCMTQRYKQDVLNELPEVDGILGTGSYGDICAAIDEVMGASGLRPCHLGSIHTAPQDGGRILSTPPWYAYLRIAEGCDNHCAYCVIPSLRGKYRSRPMEGLLEEARELADAGVKELLVIAQDITRYGTDLNGEHQLASLLRELCRLDFHWVRLHYLYPDEITEELIDTIAEEPKIVKYLDIPIQHCNDGILKAMNRRDTKAELLDLLTKLRPASPAWCCGPASSPACPARARRSWKSCVSFSGRQRLNGPGCSPSPRRRAPGRPRWTMWTWRRPAAGRSWWWTFSPTSSTRTTSLFWERSGRCCARASTARPRCTSAAATPSPRTSTAASGLTRTGRWNRAPL